MEVLGTQALVISNRKRISNNWDLRTQKGCFVG